MTKSPYLIRLSLILLLAATTLQAGAPCMNLPAFNSESYLLFKGDASVCWQYCMMRHGCRSGCSNACQERCDLLTGQQCYEVPNPYAAKGPSDDVSLPTPREIMSGGN